MNYKIEKNTVQETLIIPLYARKMCSELYPNLYRDEAALRLVGAVDYDFSALQKKSKSLMQRFGFLEVAMRQNDLAIEVREYLKCHPNAAVVNLGCGLDSTGRACDNGKCKLYNLDFPDVIAVRNELLPAREREENIPCDLNDTSWFERIDASGGAVFFAAGVFYYFLRRLSGRRAGVRCRQREGSKADAENMAEGCGNQGCRRVLRRFGRQARDWCMGQSLAYRQPGLYAGLPRSDRPVRQRIFPLSCKGR